MATAPPTQAVFWRRRVVALALIAALLIALLAWIGGGDTAQDQGATPAATSTPPITVPQSPGEPSTRSGESDETDAQSGGATGAAPAAPSAQQVPAPQTTSTPAPATKAGPNPRTGGVSSDTSTAPTGGAQAK